MTNTINETEHIFENPYKMKRGYAKSSNDKRGLLQISNNLMEKQQTRIKERVKKKQYP